MPDSVFNVLEKLVKNSEKIYETAKAAVEGDYRTAITNGIGFIKMDKNLNKVIKGTFNLASNPETWTNFENTWHKSIAEFGLIAGDGFIKGNNEWDKVKDVLNFVKNSPNLNDFKVDYLLNAAVNKALQVICDVYVFTILFVCDVSKFAQKKKKVFFWFLFFLKNNGCLYKNQFARLCVCVCVCFEKKKISSIKTQTKHK